MVVFKNRARSDIKVCKTYHQSSPVITELELTLHKDHCEIDPMVNRKLEICNDVERNPGPNTGGKTPINDNPRVMKIGKLSTTDIVKIQIKYIYHENLYFDYVMI